MQSPIKRNSSAVIMVAMAALSGCGGGSGDSSSAAPLIALAAASELVPIPSPTQTPTPAPTPATAASGFTAVQQWRGLFGPLDIKSEGKGYDIKLKTKDDSDIYVTRNAIAVGGQSGWHTHPGPSLITVTVGEIVAYDSDDPLCAPTRYTVGQGFVDSGDHAHLLRNQSASPAETVAVQFLPRGSVRRVDAAQPSHCTV